MGEGEARILTSAQMKQAEAAAVDRGISYWQLMENAGTAAAEVLQRLAAEETLRRHILLLCGRGNNAGDAFVVARLLAEGGWQAELLLLCGRGFSPLAAQNLAALPDNVAVGEELEGANFGAAVICDGVFGTGFHGELPQAVAAACRRANEAGGRRVALDLPSGLNPDTGHIAAHTFKAAHTLTFGAYKPGLVMESTRAVCGRLHCLDIGL